MNKATSKTLSRYVASRAASIWSGHWIGGWHRARSVGSSPQFWVIITCLWTFPAFAQNQRTTGTIMVWAAPSGVCLSNSPMEYYSSGNQYWGCVLPLITSLTGTWTQISGGGGGGTVTGAGFATNLGTVSGSPITVSGTITNTVAAADVVGLFSACSGVQYLGADGACHTPSGGATIPNTTNIIKGDGAGNGADSGYVAQNASTSLTGFLTSTDWNTFNGKGSVSSVATGCGASGGTITTTGTILGIGDCVTIANETGTGTTTNKLVKLTGAPSKAIITGTGDTTGIIGVCDSACGNSGSAVIQQSGLHITTVDGSGSTAGHWAQPSTSIAGDTMDSGVASTSAPPAGSIGIYLQTFGGLSTVVTDLINNLAGATSAGTVTHTGTLSTDEPVFGNGTADIKVGTKSGNTNEVGTVSGALVSGNCITVDTGGNLVDSTIPCGGGGGGGGGSGGGGGNIVPANWTTLGATSTRTDNANSIRIVAASSGTNKIDGVYHTVSAGNFTIFLGYIAAVPAGASGPPAILAGFTDGTNTEGLGIDSNNGATIQRGLKDDAISGGTTTAANGIISGTCTCAPVNNPVFIKLTRTGTALSAWMSLDNGISYTQYFNDTAPFMTATAVAVYIQSRSSNDQESFTLTSSSLP